MLKVEIMTSFRSAIDLETEINSWLRDYRDEFEVVDIKYTAMDYIWSVMIIYKNK